MPVTFGQDMHDVMLPTTEIDPFGDDFLADPYRYHPMLRALGPLFWIEKYGIYGIARYAPVKAVLEDWQTFVSARGVGLSDFAREDPWRPPSLLLETDPPEHDRTRAIMNKVVSLPSLKAARARWAEAADRLVDSLVAQRRFDAVTDLAEVFPLAVFPDTIGMRQDGRDNLLKYAVLAFNAFGPRNRLFEESLAAALPAMAWVDEACRRENLTPDGWGAAVYGAADEGACSLDEAHRLVRSFLSAGVDTTINGIGNLLNAFIHNPDQWKILRGDPKLIKKAFEEALRWDSTAQTFFRTADKPAVIEGHAIPKGSKVLLFLASANRDPNRWNDAERFDIQRQASGHVGFGFGIHQCLGQMVARLEAEVLLEAMLPRIAEIRPSGPAVRRLNNTLHALSNLPVSVTP